MPLPTVDFLGIGAQRAGTTWLHSCLRPHPRVWLPPGKELHYFDRLSGQGPGFTRVGSLWRGVTGRGIESVDWRTRVAGSLLSVRRRHGLSAAAARELLWVASFYAPGRKTDAWYRRLFAPGENRLKGEITPEYAMLDDAGVRHVTGMFPNLKVIFILRDPVDRAQSMFHLRRKNNRRRGMPPPPDVMRFLVSDASTRFNDYLRTIDTWSRYVPPDRFFLGWYDDTVADPQAAIQRVAAFLGVDPDEPRMLRNASKVFNAREPGDPSIPREAIEALARVERPRIAALAERLGGHATTWLDRCDAILSGGAADD